MFKLQAAYRLLSMHEVHADPFEGWINTLQYDYDRPEGADYAVVDAPLREVLNKLKGNEWEGTPERIGKGDHAVSLSSEGPTKTRITSIK